MVQESHRALGYVEWVCDECKYMTVLSQGSGRALVGMVGAQTNGGNRHLFGGCFCVAGGLQLWLTSARNKGGAFWELLT